MKNKNIIIIGGSRGIGRAITEKYLKEKYIVHIISRNENDFIKKLNKSVFFYKCDVSNLQNLEEVRGEIISNSPKIDTIISNVGDGKGQTKAIQDDTDWKYSWVTNFETALNVSKVFVEDLNNSKGNLLFVSSIAGLEYIGAPVSYSVSKSALISFSKNLSKKLAPEIRVNVVAPGNIFFKNGTWDKKIKANPDFVENLLKNNVPLKRFGTPEEVAELVYFINSEKASFITGSCIVIDGGQTNML